MTRINRLALLALMLVVTRGSHALGEEPTWTGKDIILKQNGSRIGHTDADGKQTYVAKLTSISYRVLSDKDGWIRVRHGKVDGWFDKAEAVLLDDADSYFSKLIRGNPNNDQYYARRGWAFYLLRDYDRAANDYSQAVRLRPTENDWLTSRGIILRAKGDFDSAIRDFDRAIQLNPRSAMLYHQRGWTYYSKQEYDKTIADCNTCLQIDPTNCLGLNRRGMAMMAIKDTDRAIEDFTEVLRDHECSVALSNRAGARISKNEFEQAVKDYEQAIKVDETNAQAPNGLAWLLATCSNPKYRDGKRAVELARKAIELDSREMTYLGTLSAALAETGKFDEAIGQQEKALENSAYAKAHGEEAQARLKLYREGKPYTVPHTVLRPATDKKVDGAVVPKAKGPVTITEGTLKGWIEFADPDGSFTIAFPGKPKSHKQSVPSVNGTVENYACSHEGPEITCLISYFDLPQNVAITLKNSTAAYAAARKGRIASEKAITLGNLNGLEVVVQLPDQKASRVRLFEVGQRRFQVVVEGPSMQVTSEQATGFLDSLKLKSK